MYFFNNICKKINLNTNRIININRRKKNILILSFVFTLIIISIQIYITIFYNATLPIYIVLLNIFAILAFLLTSFYSLYKTAKVEIITQDLEHLKQYNKTLGLLNDNVRCFKHDFNNIVTTIGGYVQTDDMKGLKRYYSDLVDDCQKISNLNILSPNVINNPAIYTLLATKYHLADEKGVKINLEIFLDLNSLNMKIYDFTKVLGILLDNAIEAAIECERKIVNLIIRKDEKYKRQILLVENTYLDKNIDTEKIFEKGNSSKTSHTGLGLWEIRKILRKNNNLNLYTTKDNKFFKQQLEMY